MLDEDAVGVYVKYITELVCVRPESNLLPVDYQERVTGVPNQVVVPLHPNRTECGSECYDDYTLSGRSFTLAQNIGTHDETVAWNAEWMCKATEGMSGLTIQSANSGPVRAIWKECTQLPR